MNRAEGPLSRVPDSFGRGREKDRPVPAPPPGAGARRRSRVSSRGYLLLLRHGTERVSVDPIGGEPRLLGAAQPRARPTGIPPAGDPPVPGAAGAGQTGGREERRTHRPGNGRPANQGIPPAAGTVGGRRIGGRHGLDPQGAAGEIRFRAGVHAQGGRASRRGVCRDSPDDPGVSNRTRPVGQDRIRPPMP